MNLLLLTEGDAERASGSGSGTPHSVMTGLRALGHTVVTGDADLYGLERWLGAAASFRPARQRWAVRYHMGRVPFALRSANAARVVAARLPAPDAVLQYGATFYPGTHVPYFLYCDSTIRIAARWPAYSWAGKMTARELDAAAQREARVYRNARRIFTFSDHVKDLLVEDFRLPAGRVETVYAGPNAEPSAVAALGGEAGVPAPNVLFVGREFARKGGEILLRAFAQVRDALPAATLTIVGPRELQVDQPGVTNLGYLNTDDPEQKARLLRAFGDATVFCFPTQYEPFGLAVLEAMYAGLPCVASRAWAIPEMVVDGETGFTVSPSDIDGFAQRILELLRNPDVARRMGAAARARAERLFNWAAVTRTMADAMSAALAA